MRRPVKTSKAALARIRAWQERHKRLGLCKSCCERVAPGSWACARHLAMHKLAQARWHRAHRRPTPPRRIRCEVCKRVLVVRGHAASARRYCARCRDARKAEQHRIYARAYWHREHGAAARGKRPLR